MGEIVGERTDTIFLKPDGKKKKKQVFTYKKGVGQDESPKKTWEDDGRNWKKSFVKMFGGQKRKIWKGVALQTLEVKRRGGNGVLGV